MSVTFKGGIHPNDNKDATKAKPIIKIDGAAEHVFLLQQHIGAPLKPVVEIGDTVSVGQLIADTDAFVSAPLHSSIS